MPTRRDSLAFLAAATTTLLSVAFLAQAIDLSPEQPGRVRAPRDEEAIRLIARDAKFAKDGVFTVGNNTGRLPFAGYASDTKTVIGAEIDLAARRRRARPPARDRLDLVGRLPLGLASGRFDAVISNVTVTEQRKEKFDFSTYRKDLLGFYVKAGNPLVIREPKDVAGLKVIVSRAPTRSRSAALERPEREGGLKPVEAQYYDDDVVLYLALESGRADAYLGPTPPELQGGREGKTRLAGNSAAAGRWRPRSP